MKEQPTLIDKLIETLDETIDVITELKDQLAVIIEEFESDE